MKEQLTAALFPGDDEHTYAVLDGAACPELLDRLEEHDPEHVCLFTGELAPDLAKCAPYLVALPPEHSFTDWLLDEGFGRHWGIFARSFAGFRALRKHFRTFLKVRAPDGSAVLFRYYDPRVLKLYLPTCNVRELAHVFGPLTAYLYEEPTPPALLGYRFEQGVGRQLRVALNP